MTRQRLLSLTLACVIVTVLCPAGVDAADAEPDWVVQAGAVDPPDPLAPYLYTKYYPDRLEVHRGQEVEWRNAGFHSVTFVPTGVEAPPLLRDDELDGWMALNEAVFFDASPCGGEDPCVLSSTEQYVNSGLNFESFRVQIDLPEGTYEYLCLVHPGMQGAIEVTDEPLPSRTSVETAAEAAIAADTAAADALFAARQEPRSVVEDGTRTWTVYAGDSTADNSVAIIAFMPTQLEVDQGDRVRYVMERPGLVDEVHTVTFPGGAVEVAQADPPGVPLGLMTAAFVPACDADDPRSGAPGVAYLVVCPANFELLLSPIVTRGHPAPEDEVTTPATYHDSGLIVPADAPDRMRPPGRTPFPSRFEARFPSAGTFTYACAVHGAFMTGGITVS